MPQYEIEFCEKDVVWNKCVIEAKSKGEAIALMKERRGKWIQLNYKDLGNDCEYFELESIRRLRPSEQYQIS